MLVEIQDLQVGDEILTALNGNLVYLKVLRPVKPSVKKDRYGKDLYKSIFCSTNRQVIVRTNPGSKFTWEQRIYMCTPENHNYNRYFNLNYKELWLVNR